MNDAHRFASLEITEELIARQTPEAQAIIRSFSRVMGNLLFGRRWLRKQTIATPPPGS